MNTSESLIVLCIIVFAIGVLIGLPMGGCANNNVLNGRLIESGGGFYNPTNGKFELRNFYSYTNSFNNK